MDDDIRRGPAGTGRTPASGRTPYIPQPRREPPPAPRHRSEPASGEPREPAFRDRRGPAPRHRRVPADATPIYPLPGGWPEPDEATPPAEAGPQPSAHPRWRGLALILIMIGLVVLALLSLRTVLGAADVHPGRPPAHPHPAADCPTVDSDPA